MVSSAKIEHLAFIIKTVIVMKKTAILLLVGSLLACNSSSSSSPASSNKYVNEAPVPVNKYDIETARLLGKLFFLANPYEVINTPENVTNLVRNNAHLLGENSKVIQCARELGQLLMQQGLGSFDNNDRERMYDIGHRNGVDPLVTKRAADDMHNGSVNFFGMAQELIWLSQVIPEAAQGNWEPFNTTGTEMRKEFYRVWSIIGPIINGGYADLDMREIMDQMMAQLQPITEYQILILTMMIQN